MSKLYSISRKQNIPTSIDDIWDFISAPQNLKNITPEYMDFKITSENLSKIMHTGMIIKYKVSPVLGIKLNWVTEITHLDEKKYFVDEQRFGPYKFWHHQHILKIIDRGIEMTDIIHYKIPMGFIGDILNKFFINKQLKEIFDFRHKKIEEKFGIYQ